MGDSGWWASDIHLHALLVYSNLHRSFLATTVTFGYINAFGVYQDIYTRSGAASASKISWIGSTELFFLLAMGLPSGVLLDKGYFRVTMAFGSLLYIFSCVLWYRFSREQTTNVFPNSHLKSIHGLSRRSRQVLPDLLIARRRDGYWGRSHLRTFIGYSSPSLACTPCIGHGNCCHRSMLCHTSIGRR